MRTTDRLLTLVILVASLALYEFFRGVSLSSVGQRVLMVLQGNTSKRWVSSHGKVSVRTCKDCKSNGVEQLYVNNEKAAPTEAEKISIEKVVSFRNGDVFLVSFLYSNDCISYRMVYLFDGSKTIVTEDFGTCDAAYRDISVSSDRVMMTFNGSVKLDFMFDGKNLFRDEVLDSKYGDFRIRKCLGACWDNNRLLFKGKSVLEANVILEEKFHSTDSEAFLLSVIDIPSCNRYQFVEVSHRGVATSKEFGDCGVPYVRGVLGSVQLIFPRFEQGKNGRRNREIINQRYVYKNGILKEF